MAEHENCTEAHLGLATTKELIDELAARVEIALAVGDSWPTNSFTLAESESEYQKAKTHYGNLLEEANGESAPLLEPTCSCPEGPELGRREGWAHPRCARCLLFVNPIF